MTSGTDIEDLRRVAEELQECAEAHAPDARLVGNVRAGDVATLCAVAGELLDDEQTRPDVGVYWRDWCTGEQLCVLKAAEVPRDAFNARFDMAVALRAFFVGMTHWELRSVRERAEKAEQKVAMYEARIDTEQRGNGDGGYGGGRQPGAQQDDWSSNDDGQIPF